MNSQRQRFWVAMVLTLLLHALVMFVLWMQPAGRFSAAVNAFIPVEFADIESTEGEASTLEQQLRAQMESRVSNLVANANASVSSEMQSTGAHDEVRMAEEVEADLRALEKAEFERLASEEKDFGLEGVPNDGQNSRVNTLSGWDQRYDGRVIVSYDVADRIHVYLPIPGYQCLEAGKVVVEIEIARDGKVAKASVVQSTAGNAEACLSAAAIKYARRSVFQTRTDEYQSGIITYEFVAQ